MRRGWKENRVEERGMGNEEERREGRRVGSGKNGKKWGWGRGR